MENNHGLFMWIGAWHMETESARIVPLQQAKEAKAVSLSIWLDKEIYHGIEIVIVVFISLCTAGFILFALANIAQPYCRKCWTT